ncbi:hypothetical protein ACWGH5_29025 [Streptomyces sp. NPDC054864]
MMRHLYSRRTIRTTAVTLGAAIALGAPAAAYAATQDSGTDHETAVTSVAHADSHGVDAFSVAQQRKLVQTQKLADGSVGKIYKVGGKFEADIFYQGKKIGTLKAGKTVLKHHGVNYSFHPYKGKLWAEKAGKAKPNSDEQKKRDGITDPVPNPTPDDGITDPVPNPTPDDGITDPIPNPTPDDISGTAPAGPAAALPSALTASSHTAAPHSVITVAQQGKAGKKLVAVKGLVDGSVAKVYKTGKTFRAEITSKGKSVGVINGRGTIKFGETGGLGVVNVTMTSNGKVTSWLSNPKPKPGAGQDEQQKDDKKDEPIKPIPAPDDDIAPAPLPEAGAAA